MTENEIVFEVLEATGLNFQVAKTELYSQKGTEVPNRFGVERSDTNDIIGIVGDRYHFLQNKDAIQLLLRSANGSFDSEASFSHPWNNTGETGSLGDYGNMGGGSLKGGEKVFLQLELPQVDIGRSGLNRYITVTNSHDGSSSLGFGTTNQVVCCENTFAMAHKLVSKYRHTASMQERLDEAMKLFQSALSFDQKQLEVFDMAANKQFDKNHIQDIVMSVFGQDMKTLTTDISARRRNQMVKLSNDISQSVVEQGETLWALFNGVTRYTNHSTERKDKVDSILTGTDAKIAERAFQTMLGWLNVDKKELVMA